MNTHKYNKTNKIRVGHTMNTHKYNKTNKIRVAKYEQQNQQKYSFYCLVISLTSCTMP